MTLRICWSAGNRVGVDLIEERRIVGKVKEAGKRVQRTRRTIEIVVVELASELAA